MLFTPGRGKSYGRPDTVPLVETQLLKPVDVNGVNKMAGEWFHMVYHAAHTESGTFRFG